MKRDEIFMGNVTDRVSGTGNCGVYLMTKYFRQECLLPSNV